jgi:hypothetical protein
MEQRISQEKICRQMRENVPPPPPTTAVYLTRKEGESGGGWSLFAI